VKSRALRHTVAGVGVLGLLVGCATIYKSTAGDYVDAAKQITGAMQTAAAALSAADTKWKGDLIAQDQHCPISREIIYLRPAAIEATDLPPPYFHGLVDKASLGSLPQCQVLERNAASKSACFTEDESFCLDQVSHFYSATASQASATADQKKDGAQVSTALSRLAYGSPLPDNYIAASSIRIVSAYLDILGKAADGQASDVKKQAQNLSDDIKSTASTYKSVTGKDLLKSTDLSGAESGLTDVGAFAQDIAVMFETAKDTATIKEAVRKTHADADKAMDTLQELVTSDARLAGVLTNIEVLRERADLQKNFSAAATVGERVIIIGRLQALPSDSTATLVKSAATIFDKAKQSHATLVQLIENPSDKQLAQIRAQEFASFRSAAQDLASLFLLLCK
jgi:hypothetical protein